MFALIIPGRHLFLWLWEGEGLGGVEGGLSRVKSNRNAIHRDVSLSLTIDPPFFFFPAPSASETQWVKHTRWTRLTAHYSAQSLHSPHKASVEEYTAKPIATISV